MTEDARREAGQLFCPADAALVAQKRKAHLLSRDYNALGEDEEPRRQEILREILGQLGENSFMQGPIFFHYGLHTRIGRRFFANYNLTVQDDAAVTIGDDCSFGPNVTIVTPQHPIVAAERLAMADSEGKPTRVCYAKPVSIGSRCWLGANVVVCPGVTIGDDCVIGAGSVVTKDIPSACVAAGNPAKVLRRITQADSMANFPEISGDYSVL